MLDVGQFRELIVVPALEVLEAHSLAAEELVLGTGIQESRLKYLRQIGGGPAVGLYQMEPATHDDIWDNFLRHKESLRRKLESLSKHRVAIAMASDLWYATAMCRIHYLRKSAPLPPEGDLAAQAAYWKQHYNTPAGAGTTEEYIRNVEPWL